MGNAIAGDADVSAHPLVAASVDQLGAFDD
jgi:hypothetical protein